MDQKEENELREVYARHMEAERDRKMKMEEKNKKGEDSLDGNVARAGNWEKESEGNSDRRGNRPEEENGNGI